MSMDQGEAWSDLKQAYLPGIDEQVDIKMSDPSGLVSRGITSLCIDDEKMHMCCMQKRS